MKTLLLALALGCHSALAQSTYFNQWFTNVPAPIYGTATNSFDLATNTLAIPWSSPWPAADTSIVRLSATYDSGEAQFVYNTLSYPAILGPCKVTLALACAATNPVPFLWRLETVNTTPVAGMAVVPSGLSATLRLDTSQDLTIWKTLTNATLSATNGNRFFRLALSHP